MPILIPELLADYGLACELVAGPALLLSHGCTMDKASNKGVMKIRRLFFLPISSIETLDGNAKGLLRKRTLEPPEAIHLGRLGILGEAYATLSEAYYLPAAFFAPQLSEFEHPEAEAGKRHLQVLRGDTRIGRIDEQEVHLLLGKMNAFWTRRVAPDDLPTYADPSPSASPTELVGLVARTGVSLFRQLRRSLLP